MTLSFVPGGTAGHITEPAAGSYVRENGGGHANLLENADYPVIAECRICHRRIKLDYLLQAEWRHAPTEQAVPAAGAPSVPAADAP